MEWNNQNEAKKTENKNMFSLEISIFFVQQFKAQCDKCTAHFKLFRQFIFSLFHDLRVPFEFPSLRYEKINFPSARCVTKKR